MQPRSEDREQEARARRLDGMRDSRGRVEEVPRLGGLDPVGEPEHCRAVEHDHQLVVLVVNMQH